MAIAKLSIDLEARLAGLQQGLDKAARLAEKDSQRIARAFDGARTAAAGVAATLAGALSVGATVAWVKNAVDAADAASKQARQLGLLTEEVSALNYAAGLAGVSQDQLTTSMVQLSRLTADAGAGVKSAADTFERLGINVRGADGALKGQRLLLDEIADRFSRLPAGVEKTAIATKLFGEAGTRMISMLDGGAAGLAKAADEAQRFGVIVSTEAGVAAEKLNDDMARLRKQADGLANTIAFKLAPQLAHYAEQLNALLSGTKSDFTLNTEIQQVRLELDKLRGLQGEGFTVLGFFGSEEQRAAEIARLEKQLDGLLQRFYRLSDVQGGRGSVVPAFALAAPAGAPPKAPKAPGSTTRDLAPPELSVALRDALQAIEQTDTSKVAALNAQLDELFNLRATGLFGPEIEEAINKVRDDLAKLNPEAVKAADAAKRLQDILGMTPGGQLREVLTDIELINKAYAKGQIDAEQWAQAARLTTGRISKTTEEAEKLNTVVVEIGRSFGRAFEDAVVGGEDLRGVINALERDLLRLGTNELITKPFEKWLKGLGDDGEGFDLAGLLGKAGAGAGDFLSSLFGGFFADGGYLPPGRWGIAGERGPEPIFGGRTGLTVRPSGGQVSVVNNFTLSGPVDRRTQQQIAAEVGMSVQRAMGRNA